MMTTRAAMQYNISLVSALRSVTVATYRRTAGSCLVTMRKHTHSAVRGFTFVAKLPCPVHSRTLGCCSRAELQPADAAGTTTV
jgi:hypothetical protein